MSSGGKTKGQLGRPARKYKTLSLHRALERARRDGTPSNKILVYATDKEKSRWMAMARARNQSLSEAITTALCDSQFREAHYFITLPGYLAGKAEQIAEILGYSSAKEWFETTIKNNCINLKVEYAGKWPYDPIEACIPSVVRDDDPTPEEEIRDEDKPG